jgi:uncharacterized protein
VILTNEFDVRAPIEQIWKLLDQIEIVVPCMPGASYLGREGDNHRMAIRMKLGAVSTHFQGAAHFEERNEATHTVRIRGSSKDTGGKGSATATVTATLEPLANAGTHVTVKTDLVITGKIAQFGGGLVTDISSRLIAQFAQNLQQLIEAQQSVQPPPMGDVAQAQATVATTIGTSGSETAAQEPPALDLGQVMLPAILTFGRRYVAIPVIFFVLGWLAGRYL